MIFLGRREQKATFPPCGTCYGLWPASPVLCVLLRGGPKLTTRGKDDVRIAILRSCAQPAMSQPMAGIFPLAASSVRKRPGPQTGVMLLISASCQCYVSVITTLCLGYSNLIATSSQPYCSLIARLLSHDGDYYPRNAPKRHTFRESRKRCTVVRRGSCSLDLGLSGLD